MKRSYLLIGIIFILIFILILPACSPDKGVTKKEKQETGEQQQLPEKDQVTDIEEELLTGEGDLIGENLNIKPGPEKEKEKFAHSPFSGKLIAEKLLQKAVMVSVENISHSRPQSGLQEASIVYEFLVEGGITRFLALYWYQIPEKIGPIRSVRPYLIKTALEYDALLLHAGASPAGFDMLARADINNLDQIYKGRYFWRDNQREKPHNLYSGDFKIEDYLNRLTDINYNDRFKFQQVRLITGSDQNTAHKIYIDYWGGYNVIYKYHSQENRYYRFLNNLEQPHLTEAGNQLTAKNIIVQYVDTEIKDSVGRLKMKLEGKGKALLFCDGIVINGYWEKSGDQWTQFYTENGEKFMLNPGQTWINIVPQSSRVTYEGSEAGDRTETGDKGEVDREGKKS